MLIDGSGMDLEGILYYRNYRRNGAESQDDTEKQKYDVLGS